MAKKTTRRVVPEPARKRVRVPVAWTPDRRDTSLDTLFGSMAGSARLKLGTELVSVGSGEDQLTVGLRLGHLSLRYMFQSDVFPLGRILQIVGEEGSAKTTLFYEILRWHCMHSGGGCVAENENKDSPDLRKGILQYHTPWLNRLNIARTWSMEMWQDYFSWALDTARSTMDAKDGPGRTIPLFVGVDSLTGTSVLEDIGKTDTAGHSSRGYGLMANLIARFMRDRVGSFIGYPITLCATNHLKPAKTDQGIRIDNVPGGKAVPFMATYMVKMDRLADLSKLEYEGLRVKLTCTKNSLGPSRKHIVAEFLWWTHVFPDGSWRREFAWDWNTATIEMLLLFERIEGKKTLFKSLMDVVDLRARKTDRKVWSRTLGIPEDSPVNYREAGAMLETREDLLRPLHALLGVACRTPFHPAVDFRNAMAAERRRAEVAVQPLYADTSVLPVLQPNQPNDAAMDAEARPADDVAEEEIRS